MIDDEPLSGLRSGIPAGTAEAGMVAVDMVTMVRQMGSQCLGGVAGWVVEMAAYLIHFMAAHTMAGGKALMNSPKAAKPMP